MTTRPLKIPEFDRVLAESRRSGQAEDMVYVVRAGNTVKIGHSFDVPQRLGSLQTGNPYPVVLFIMARGGKAAEQHLHHCFDRQRMMGEWFVESVDLWSTVLAFAEATYGEAVTREAVAEAEASEREEYNRIGLLYNDNDRAANALKNKVTRGADGRASAARIEANSRELARLDRRYGRRDEALRQPKPQAPAAPERVARPVVCSVPVLHDVIGCTCYEWRGRVRAV